MFFFVWKQAGEFDPTNKSTWISDGTILNMYDTPALVYGIEEDPKYPEYLYFSVLATFDDGPQTSMDFCMWVDKDGQLLMES